MGADTRTFGGGAAYPSYPPRSLFKRPAARGDGPPFTIGISGDRDRFILVEPTVSETDQDAERSGIKVVQNWIREFQP